MEDLNPELRIFVSQVNCMLDTEDGLLDDI